MTTPCTRVTTLLAATPEAGRALATLEAGLAAHVATCARCQSAVDAAQRLVDELAAVHADFEPPSNLVAVAMRRAAEPSPARAEKAGASSPMRGYLVAGLIGAAVAAAAVLMATPSDDERDDRDDRARVAEEGTAPRGDGAPAVATPNERAGDVDDDGLTVAACLGDGGETSCDVGDEIATAIGETRAYRLSDGTTLQVDQDSVIRLDAERRALRVVRGDAFLDVSHRPDLEALRVTLPTGEVEVLGTELEVRAGEALSIVDVKRGVVAVAGGDDGEARVRAGQTAWLRAGRKPVVRTANGLASGARTWGRGASGAASDEASANLGFGSIRARRPGAASDADKPLRLVDHIVDVRVQGAFAKTTIEESFASDEAHELEGIYRFTLPPGAQVEELSLMVDGVWEEGAYVERDRAEKIWAGVIRNATPVVKRREIVEYIWVPGPWRDPALLTKSLGNSFELRIFPIPARGERRVRIAYTESLPLVTGGRRYVLPLPSDGDSARAERFALAMKIGTSVGASDLRIRNYELEHEARDGQVLLRTESRSFRPKGDLIVEIPDLAAADDLQVTAWGKRRGTTGDGDGHDGADGYLALTLRPELAASGGDGEREPVDVLVIADTSYGMQKLRLQRAGEVLRRLVEGLDEGDRVQVLACATTCRSLGAFEPASASLGRDLGARVASLEPLGATRLGAAFEAAAKALEASASERRRIIYLGDGVQTVGELDPARVVESARAAIGETRVSAVGLGGETDHAVMSGLAREHAGSFIDLATVGGVEATAALLLARQHAEPLRDVELVLPDGLVEVAPARFADLWPGEERVVTARTSRADVFGDVVLRGTLAGEPVERRWTIEVTVDEQAGNAFVPRLWAERRIADLEVRDDLGTKAEVVKLSQAHHVLSRYTSLLVLESPAMARAFDVRATAAVADWSGDEAARHGGGELVGATGGITADAPDEHGIELEDGLDGDLEVGALGKSRSGAGDEAKANKTAEVASHSGPVGGRFDADPEPLQPTVPSARKPREAMRPPDPRGGRWVARKKVWYKEAVVREHSEQADPSLERELAARERSLDEEPNSRERTIALVRWHVRMNAPESAARIAERWLEKDRMDPDALVALADIAALEGDLDRSKALLSSAVEADPRRAPSHLRMARLYEAEGDVAMACEHLLSRALVARGDVGAQVEAVRCGAREARVLSGLEEKLRARVERQLDRAPKVRRLAGPWRLEATWDGDADLDLLAVSPEGEVVSWQGGAEVRADGVDSERGEELVFKGRTNGRWQILVVRKDGDERVRAEGTLRVTSYGVTRRIPFVIGEDEKSVTIADVDLASRFRWEEVNP